MGKAVDILSIVLLACAIGGFSLGFRALANGQDVVALYWLAVGALLLRSATDMLRPKAVR